MADRGAATSWSNWREETRRLDYDGHEVRIIFEEQPGAHPNAHSDPAIFGDFDPTADEPDPDVWPLEFYDPGAPADTEDLIRLTNSFPAPHVKWVTEEYLDSLYGHDPRSVEVNPEDIPSRTHPSDSRSGGTVDAASPSTSMTLTADRGEALQRLVSLWNGEEVQGVHLLADKLPSWNALFGDLDQDELVRLRIDPDVNQTLLEAFGEYPWFTDDSSVFLRTQHILRKKVKYAPTLKARTLISGRDEFQALRGDPKEGLTHRVTVGLCAAYYALQGWTVWTYHPYRDYVVDIIVEGPSGELHFLEVLTGHHNWKLHRSTYAKLADLDSEGVPLAVFDSRQTAYAVLNHWHRAGLGDLPLGTFDSNPRINWGREKIQEAYADAGSDWVIADWFTTDWLWRHTFGPNGAAVAPDFHLSLNW